MKNSVFIATSIDGYIAYMNGDLDWLHTTVAIPEGSDLGFDGMMNQVDALIIGRKTFEVVVGFEGDWPYEKPVLVWSNILYKLPKRLEGKAFLVKGKVNEVLDQAHEMGYKHLYIDGGRTIQTLLQSDMIDEMVITTIPILLGGGVPLFGDLDEPLVWEVAKSELYLNALTQVTYRRKRE